MFGGGNRVRVSDSVLRKVRLAAEFLGLTVEEFIERSLNREAERALSLKSLNPVSDRSLAPKDTLERGEALVDQGP